MRKVTRKFIPSMYLRRLTLLSVMAAGVAAILIARLTQLTVAHGIELRKEAEDVLVTHWYLPTARGRILDRHGRVLAEDQPSYNLAVHYDVITESWAYDQAYRKARKEHREIWEELGSWQREQYAARYMPEFNAQVEQLWRTLSEIGGVEREMLEQRISQILARIQRHAAAASFRRQVRRERELGDTVDYADSVVRIREQVESHTLLSDIQGRTLLEVRRLIARAKTGDESRLIWKEVEVSPGRGRRYPSEQMRVQVDRRKMPTPLRADEPVEVMLPAVGVHTVGGLRRVWSEDIEQRQFGDHDFGGYRPGDRTGSWGIEQSMERHLRGLRGRVELHRDTGLETRLEPRSGHDVILSVDARLQARIEALMQPSVGLTVRQPWHNYVKGSLGEELNAAAVVMSVDRAQVLAAVSVPSFSREQLRHDANYFRDPLRQPFIHRPVAAAYPPGSTVKPLVLAAAVTAGKLGRHEIINCRGHFFENRPDILRDWIYKRYGVSFGRIDGVRALTVSSNVFFNHLGERLGTQGITDWYQRYGLGRRPNCGLREAIGGMIDGQTYSDALFLAMGQGPIAITPLQLAAAHTAIARGGQWVEPTFLISPEPAPLSRNRQSLDLSDAAVDMALKGMHGVVHNREHGTAVTIGIPDVGKEDIFNIEGVTVRGKTGTAQAPDLRADTDGDGNVDVTLREGDHGWFVCYAQREAASKPDFVIVVVVEYGGSGSRVAGPIANQILHALRAEGYL